MRYIPPNRRLQDAYDRGVQSVMPWIVIAAIIGLIIGFFVGYTL